MAAGGEYAESSLSQRAAFDLTCPAVLAHADQTDDNGMPLTVVDYGCADCRASKGLIEQLALKLAGRRQLRYVCQDLQGNDWTAAAAELESIGPLQSVGTMLPRSEAAALTLLSAPSSFYDQVLGDGTVDIAVSSIAFHWMSDTAELPLPDSVSSASVHPHLDPGGAWHAAWRRRGQADWRRIISQRSRELRPGGLLVAAMSGVDDRTERWTYDVLCEIMDEILRSWATRGRITETRRRQLQLAGPFWLRTQDELRAPFLEGSASMRLLDITTHHLPNPYLACEPWEGAYLASILAWLGPMLRRTLDASLYEQFLAELSDGLHRRRADLERDYVVHLLRAVKDG